MTDEAYASADSQQEAQLLQASVNLNAEGCTVDVPYSFLYKWRGQVMSDSAVSFVDQFLKKADIPFIQIKDDSWQIINTRLHLIANHAAPTLKKSKKSKKQFFQLLNKFYKRALREDESVSDRTNGPQHLRRQSWSIGQWLWRMEEEVLELGESQGEFVWGNGKGKKQATGKSWGRTSYQQKIEACLEAILEEAKHRK